LAHIDPRASLIPDPSNLTYPRPVQPRRLVVLSGLGRALSSRQSATPSTEGGNRRLACSGPARDPVLSFDVSATANWPTDQLPPLFLVSSRDHQKV